MNQKDNFIQIGFFSSLSETTLSLIAKVAIHQSIPEGTLFLIEGEPCTAIYFIISGDVSIFRLATDGREQVLTRLKPGQSFNTVPPFQKERRNHANAKAVTNVELLVILIEDYYQLIRDCPDFNIAILQDFADRLDHLTALVESLSLYSVRGRLARFFLTGIEANQTAKQFTQEEIAAQIGTVREVVSRTMRGLIKEGIIEINRHEINILDKEALKRVASSQ